MTISRSSFNSGLYIGLGTLFIAMIGMFTAFSELNIVVFSDVEFITSAGLPLSEVILAGILLAAGFYAARQIGNSDVLKVIANGAVAAGVVTLILAVLVFIASPSGLQSVLHGLGATDVTLDLQRITADETLFPNVKPELIDRLSFGQESILIGMLLLVGTGLLGGAVGGLGVFLSDRARNIVLFTILIIITLGLLQEQLNEIISLPDALFVVGIVCVGYVLAIVGRQNALARRIMFSALLGAGLGLLLALVIVAAQPESGALPDFLEGSQATVLISFVQGQDALGIFILFTLVGTLLGTTGAVLSATSATAHNAGVTIVLSLLILGVLNSAGETLFLPVVVITLITVVGQLILRQTTPRAVRFFESLNPRGQRTSVIITGMAGLAFVLILPQILNSNVSNILDLVGLYVMMGLGLNIVVGFAGLLDLGYVAFFAIGAYTTGILTTPNTISCIGAGVGVEGGFANYAAAAAAGQCPLLTTFWVGWLAAIAVSGLAGVLLGIPVLRLRGDYLAIVTLGFGEIINRLVISDAYKPFLGGAQGITNIPSPIIDLSGISPGLINSGSPLLSQLGASLADPISLSRPSEIYYLVLAGIIVSALVSYRLGKSRLGRAWRAMRDDEDVAQAMGIDLVHNKLLAFAIGAAFSGIGGALFGSYLKSIFPNSFTLLVSINVLSLIIIGGLGSIPGVFIGALMIFGLPEALREFGEFRLLMFGGLLVLTMLLRPQGLLPPASARLAEEAQKAFDKETVPREGTQAEGA